MRGDNIYALGNILVRARLIAITINPQIAVA